MKKSLCLMCLLPAFLTSCGSSGEGGSTPTKDKFTVTFVCTNYNANSGIWSNNTYSRTYEKGDTVYEPKYPNDNFIGGQYSLSRSFTTYQRDPKDLWIETDSTVYVRYYGKIACTANLVIDGATVGKFLPSFNEYLYKMPSIGDGAVYVTNYRVEDHEGWNISIDSYLKGYNFGGWYTDSNCTQPLNLPYEFDTASGSSASKYFYGKIGTPKNYTVTVNYYAGGTGSAEYLIGTKNSSLAYKTSLKDFADSLPSSVASDWKIATATSLNSVYYVSNGSTSQALSTENNGWIDASDLTIKVYITPIYQGYLKVGSNSNGDINNKYIPYDALSVGYFDDSNTVKTTVPFGSSSSVSFKLSDIYSIEFPLTTYLPSSESYDLRSLGASHYPNLNSIDFSKAKYITSIPDHFFNNCPKLETVTATDLPYLTTVGDYFLGYCALTSLNVDFSHVTKIQAPSCGFLHYAFSPSFSGSVTVNLSSLTNENGDILCHDGSTGHVTLNIGNYSGIYSDTFSCFYPRNGYYDANGYKTTMPITIVCSSQANATMISSRLTAYSNITVTYQ